MYRLLAAVTIALAVCASAESPTYDKDPNGIPYDFKWCSATAAYQIEGAYNEDGRTPSIWDAYTHLEGDKNVIAGRATGDVACDSYHKYKEDVRLLANMGAQVYRFSISPSRVLPNGRLPANELGLKYYDNLIDELEKYHIEPWVTMYHWDLPQALQDEYNGWVGEKSVDDFLVYAKVLLDRYAKRVPYWITFNEPWCICYQGYATPWKAPGNQEAPETEPYLASHHLLLAHAKTVKLYRENYAKAYQNPLTKKYGQIGITLNSDFAVPASSSSADRKAATRYLEFLLGWYANPIFKDGDYPQSMRDSVGDRLPKFTEEEKKMLKGSSDFLGLNHYTTVVAYDRPEGSSTKGWDNDKMVETTHHYANGSQLGVAAESTWLYVFSPGFHGLLEYIDRVYDHPLIVITENGVSAPNEKHFHPPQSQRDQFRVSYYREYLKAMRTAMEHGIKIGGYCAWSLLDNFEWTDGYDMRFGLHYVDMEDAERPRTPKDSASFLHDVFNHMPVLDIGYPEHYIEDDDDGMTNGDITAVVMGICMGLVIIYGVVLYCKMPSAHKAAGAMPQRNIGGFVKGPQDIEMPTNKLLSQGPSVAVTPVCPNEKVVVVE